MPLEKSTWLHLLRWTNLCGKAKRLIEHLCLCTKVRSECKSYKPPETEASPSLHTHRLHPSTRPPLHVLFDKFQRLWFNPSRPHLMHPDRWMHVKPANIYQIHLGKQTRSVRDKNIKIKAAQLEALCQTLTEITGEKWSGVVEDVPKVIDSCSFPVI